MDNSIFLLSDTDFDLFQGLYHGDIKAFDKPNSICYGMMTRIEDEGDYIPTGLILSEIGKRSVCLYYLYVVPEFRHMGLGTDLMSLFINNLTRSGIIDRIYTAASLDLLAYLAIRHDFIYDSFTYKRQLSAKLNDLEQLKPIGSEKIRSLKKIDSFIVKKFSNRLKEKNGLDCGILLPVKVDDYSDLSMAYVDGGVIKAAIFLEEVKDEIIISYAYAEGNGVELMYVISNIAEKLKQLPKDTVVKTVALNQQSEKLFCKLFSTVEYNELYEGILYL